MAAFEDYINSIISGRQDLVPFGGLVQPTSLESPIVLAMQIKGGNIIVPNLDVLADIPYDLLVIGMTVTVNQFSAGGKIYPRNKYYLYSLPPTNTRVSEVSSFVLSDYWKLDNGDQTFTAEVEIQYAPNYNGQKPLFLPSQISHDAYQAGYPTDAAFIGGNPDDIIWTSGFTNSDLWMRQRFSGNDWGIPISINQGNYSAGQYIDVIFLWVDKNSGYPGRPVQPNDQSQLPTGWQNTPGTDYATRILTQDLYRSQAVRNSYGILQSDWDIPILVSSDPNLTRYGNTPGSTDFLNDTYWRGYYTPGVDTFQATRPDTGSPWTVSKIDQESGQYVEFVFKSFPIGVQQSDLIAATPTAPEPLNGTFPNDWQDAPFDVTDNTHILYMSKATKFNDGSLKKPWSVPARFDGLDTIQAVIVDSPGDTFFQTRDGNGNLNYAFNTLTLTAQLFKGPDQITSGITGYNWYYGTTLIVFSSITNRPTNLGTTINNAILASGDRSVLTIGPAAITNSQQFKVGIVHPSRVTEYQDSIQIFDSTDDNKSFVADIIGVSGTVFKNQSGLYQFNPVFAKGGVSDPTNVVFTWSIKNASGTTLTGGLRNSGGSSIGDTNVVASTVYVSGADIDQYATLILTATFGSVVRTSQITLTDVSDATAIEALYWGTGSVDPGTPTDFSPRTLTQSEVLALNIGYSTDAGGRWYMIQNINGTWGNPIQLRSESARPNGGIALSIFKNVQQAVDGTPAAPAIPSSGSLIPAGWTSQPTAFSGSQDTTYTTSAFFILRTDVDADPTQLTRDNYNPASSSYGTPIRVTGRDGTSSGTPGNNGWSPIYAIKPGAGGVGEVLQLIDWTGGDGTKPSAGGTSSYVGLAGLTTLANAINIKGDTGATPVVPSPYVNTASGSSSNSVPIVEGSVLSLSCTNSYSATRNFLVTATVDVQLGSGGSDQGITAKLVKNRLVFGGASTFDQTDVTVMSNGKIRITLIGVVSIAASTSFTIDITLVTDAFASPSSTYTNRKIIVTGV